MEELITTPNQIFNPGKKFFRVYFRLNIHKQ